MASSYLDIIVSDASLRIRYVSDGEVCYEREHPAGFRFFEAHTFSKRARDELLTVILSTLEIISLHDRIPQMMHVFTSSHGHWFKETIESYPYAQFYLPGGKPSVIIKRTDTPPQYAGHTKTKNAFKI